MMEDSSSDGGESATAGGGPTASSGDRVPAPSSSAAGTGGSGSGSNTLNQELPFLVAHYLANFQAAAAAAGAAGGNGHGGGNAQPSSAAGWDGTGGDDGGSVPVATGAGSGPTPQERGEAMQRLRRAAGDIASAFATLGIFGSATSVSSEYASCVNLFPLQYLHRH